MRTQAVAERTPPGDPDADERALRAVARQLVLAYPWASNDHIAAILRANFDATRDSKVQNYRLVLAERDTRARLRHEAARHAPGPPDPDAIRTPCQPSFVSIPIPEPGGSPP